MKIAASAMLLIPLLAAAPATAASDKVPNAIVALMGPTVGYLMAQSDLCGWNLTDKMTKVYTEGFKTIGLTAEQEAGVWKVVRERRAALGHLPVAAKDHIKAETCTAENRARVERALMPDAP